MPTPTIDKPKSFRDRFYDGYGNPRMLQARESRGRQLVRDPSHRGYNKLRDKSVSGRLDRALAGGFNLLTDENKQKLAQTNPQEFDGLADRAGWSTTPVPPQTISQNGYQRPEVQALAQDPNLPPLEQALGQPRLEIGDTIPSPYAGQPYTRNDISGRIEGMMDSLTETQKRLLDYQQPTEAEVRLQNRLADLDAQEIELEDYGEGTGITQTIADRTTNKARRELQIQRNQLTTELQSLVELRAARNEAGQLELQFTRENLNMLQTLSEMTQPDVIETKLDELTGEIVAVTQDPMTGGFSTQVVGQVSPDLSKQVDHIGTYDTYEGTVAYGRDRRTGALVATPLTGSVGKQSELSELLTPTEAAALGVPFGTTKGEAVGLQSERTLSTSQERRLDAAIKSFDSHPIVKEYNEVQNKYLSVQSILENGVGGPADLALVFEFMKGLDPTSVVREAEYDKAAKSGNIFAGAFAKYNGYLKEEGGFLPDNVKEEFGNLMALKLEAKQTQYDNVRQGFEQRINGITGGDDGTSYLIDYNAPLESSGGGIETEILDEILSDPANASLSEEEIYQLYEEVLMDMGLGFNDVGGDTNIASRIADAISYVESGDNATAQGQSGERGAFQFMPETWKIVSQQVVGKILPQTPQNERAIAEAKIQSLLDMGYDARQIALIWNTSLGGVEKPLARKGTNQYGANYNSVAYADKVMSVFNQG